MKAFRGVRSALLLALTLGILFGVSSIAQGPANLSAANSNATADPAANADPAPASPAPLPDSASASKAAADDGWRGTIAIYGWFPAVHGTVGVLGHNAGFDASFSDVFHTLKGIIPIAVEADKGRLVIPIDFLWMKLGDGHGLPFTDETQRYVNIHLTQSILTPKVGYRVLDGEHFKVDLLAGIRYWYLGQNLA